MANEEQLKAIEDFCPIDDVFFEVISRDKNVCEEILQTVMNDPDLVVLEAHPQENVRNLMGRSVRLDAKCVLASGRIVNVEVQKADNDDHPKRVRFNVACITVDRAEVGSKFEDIPDIIIVYISRFDPFKQGKVIYHVGNCIRETNQFIDDGQEMVYVNTAVQDGSRVSDLMGNFVKNKVKDPAFPQLSRRVTDLKETEGGRLEVCEVMEKYMDKRIKATEIETTINNSITFNVPKEETIKCLVQNYGLTNEDAEIAYDNRIRFIRK